MALPIERWIRRSRWSRDWSRVAACKRVQPASPPVPHWQLRKILHLAFKLMQRLATQCTPGGIGGLWRLQGRSGRLWQLARCRRSDRNIAIHHHRSGAIQHRLRHTPPQSPTMRPMTRNEHWPVGRAVKEKSDLRNHCAIVQPRLYDSLMVSQITLGATGCRRCSMSEC